MDGAAEFNDDLTRLTNSYARPGDGPGSYEDKFRLNDMHLTLEKVLLNIDNYEVELASNRIEIGKRISYYNALVNYENKYIGKWVANRQNENMIQSEQSRHNSIHAIKNYKNRNVVIEKSIANRKLMKDFILEEMQIRVNNKEWNLGQGTLHINNVDNSIELEINGRRKQIKPETKQPIYEDIANDLNIKILNYRTKYSDLIKEKEKSTRFISKLKINKGRKTTEISKDIKELLEVIKKTNNDIRLNRLKLDEFNKNPID